MAEYRKQAADLLFSLASQIAREAGQVGAGAEVPSPTFFVEAKAQLGLAEFMLRQREGWKVSEPSQQAIVCHVEGCQARNVTDWSRPKEPALWCCDEHAPSREAGASPPAGVLPGKGLALAKAKDMAGRWQAYLVSLTSSPSESKP